MPEHQKTGTTCIACKTGEILARIGRELLQGEPGIGGRNWTPWIVEGFHCESCGISYHFPPGKPNAANEILAGLPEEREY